MQLIRIANPALHTKYLYTPNIQSFFLWTTLRPHADKYTTFLQFASATTPHQIWKYPNYISAMYDIQEIKKYGVYKPLFIMRYVVEPRFQIIGDAPPAARAAFTALNGLLPKNPL